MEDLMLVCSIDELFALISFLTGIVGTYLFIRKYAVPVVTGTCAQNDTTARHKINHFFVEIYPMQDKRKLPFLLKRLRQGEADQTNRLFPF